MIKFVKRLLIKAHLPLSINRSVCSNYISEHFGICEFFCVNIWYGVIDPLSYSEVDHCQGTAPNIFWLCKWLFLYYDISFSPESDLWVVNCVFCRTATLATNVLQPSAVSIPCGCVQPRLATQFLIKNWMVLCYTYY